jgi:hypothetical protein
MRSFILRIDKLTCTQLIDTSARLLVMLLISLSILVPTSLAFLNIKASILLVILLMVFTGMLTGQAHLSGRLYMAAFFYATIGLAWSLYGVIRENPGAIPVISVMVVYPLAIPLCSSLYRRNDNSSLYDLFYVCAWLLAASDLIYILAASSYAGTLLTRFYTSQYPSSGVVGNDAFLKFTLPNITSIIFLLPFFISALLFSKTPKAKVYVAPVVLLLIAVGAMSGRRGLILSTILGPAIAFMFTRRHSRELNKKTVNWRWGLSTPLVVIAISLCIYLSVSFVGKDYYINQVISIFDFTSNASNLVRVDQFRSLMRGIVEAPVFGSGAGAAADYIRTYKTPWAYELTYVSFVFQYGLLGFLIYASGILYLIRRLILSSKQKGRSSFEFYFLSGFIGFMLANATNPYLNSFDCMWIIFIPYAIINMELISGTDCHYGKMLVVC